MTFEIYNFSVLIPGTYMASRVAFDVDGLFDGSINMCLNYFSYIQFSVSWLGYLCTV